MMAKWMCGEGIHDLPYEYWEECPNCGRNLTGLEYERKKDEYVAQLETDLAFSRKMNRTMGITALVKEYEALQRQVEGLREALGAIVGWSEAYPLDVFPEPNFKKAHQLLKAGGMTLDAISASSMRHVVEGVGKIAKEALDV